MGKVPLTFKGSMKTLMVHCRLKTIRLFQCVIIVPALAWYNLFSVNKLHLQWLFCISAFCFIIYCAIISCLVHWVFVCKPPGFCMLQINQPLLFFAMPQTNYPSLENV